MVVVPVIVYTSSEGFGIGSGNTQIVSAVAGASVSSDRMHTAIDFRITFFKTFSNIVNFCKNHHVACTLQLPKVVGPLNSSNATEGYKIEPVLKSLLEQTSVDFLVSGKPRSRTSKC